MKESNLRLPLIGRLSYHWKNGANQGQEVVRVVGLWSM